MANQRVPHEAHKYAFHVSGPRNLTSLNWRDIFNSSWKDANYKQTAISCFTRAVYALEVDRQENRTQENALAPNWWVPFKYKLTKTLIDERDGSIFGAIFEWDRSAALADSVLIKPLGAPKAVVALRGTLLERPTMWRDVEDDLRFLAWESLMGSGRFKVALEALKSVCDTYGSRNICIAGHSLGAGFALQLGKKLAEEGICVETHAFNPPSLSLALSLAERAEYVWNGLKSMLVSSSKTQVSNDADKTASVQLLNSIPCLWGSKWVPNLYVNNNDWICCFYIDPNHGTGEEIADKEIAAKLFVVYKENQTFLEAHGLEQWWSSYAHSSKLMRRQLRSLGTASVLQITRLFYPLNVSLPMNLQDFGAKWSTLRSLLPSSDEAQVSNDGENTSVVRSKNWIRQLSGLKEACFWVGKGVPYLYGWSSYTDPDGTGEKITDKENMGPTKGQIAAELFVVSKEKLKFLAAHGLEQWWPSDSELQQAIHNSNLISRQLRYFPWEVAHLFNPSSVSLAMILSNIGESLEFVWKWNSIKSMLSSSGEAQVRNDAEKTSNVSLKSWIPPLSSLKDAGFGVAKWVHHLCVNKTDGTGEKIVDKESMDPSNGQIAAKLFVASKEKQKFHGPEQWWSSDAEQLQQVIHVSKLINGQLRSLDTSTPWQVTHLFNPPSISLANSLINAHCLEQCWSSDAVLQQAIHNSKLIRSRLRNGYTGITPSQATQGKPWWQWIYSDSLYNECSIDTSK